MKHVTEIKIMVLAAAFSAAAIAAGCANAPLKTDASTSGIRAAEEVGAAEVPQASLHLQLAKEELGNAKNLAANNENERAESMLLRAQADAELAVMLSREDTEKSEALAAVDVLDQGRRPRPRGRAPRP